MEPNHLHNQQQAQAHQAAAAPPASAAAGGGPGAGAADEEDDAATRALVDAALRLTAPPGADGGGGGAAAGPGWPAGAQLGPAAVALRCVPPFFDPLELLREAGAAAAAGSPGASAAQADVLQKSIRSLRDMQLAANLGALAVMPPEQLRELLAGQNVNVKEVVAKLVRHIDPDKARQQFGPQFFYGPREAYNAHLRAAAEAAIREHQALQQATQASAAAHPAGARGPSGGSAPDGAAGLSTPQPHQQQNPQLLATAAGHAADGAAANGDHPMAEAAAQQPSAAAHGALAAAAASPQTAAAAAPAASANSAAATALLIQRQLQIAGINLQDPGIAMSIARLVASATGGAGAGAGGQLGALLAQAQAQQNAQLMAAAAAAGGGGGGGGGGVASADPRFEPLPLRRSDSYGRNAAACAACGKTHHAELSPLCLCDFCPRSYHLACLDMEYEELRLLDWACPRCVDRLESSGATGAAAAACGYHGPVAAPGALAAAGLTMGGAAGDALRRSVRWGDPGQKAAYLAARAAVRAAEREERERQRAEARAEKERERLRWRVRGQDDLDVVEDDVEEVRRGGPPGCLH
ncbi:hypothetical protein GPECTOR_16g555 [Gonium pectorale]|uniref:PHD-type domain-containing protein n=1 Tax=Gonium pectorale TaxID=33097 RepID=A0A150GKP9_GONPE|nr:hypothetical protein GPECTOR_16g555 [Gonium pectorale]|eukprot:KXZ50382.1 hypothetical protein GPECTOR_16g555 [Gonium pectorale]